MILPFLLLLPRLFTGAGEPAGAIKLSAPHVDYKINEASATTSPWIDANGWRIRRSLGKPFFVTADGDAAALAAAEAYVYGAEVQISTDEKGTAAFNRMLDFLRTIPPMDAKPVANIGVVDDGSD